MKPRALAFYNDRERDRCPIDMIHAIRGRQHAKMFLQHLPLAVLLSLLPTALRADDLITVYRMNSVSYNAWATMTDTEGEPNNSPFSADTTCLQRDVASNKPIYNLDFSIMGHFMKFIPRGSTRIYSKADRGVDHLAFVGPGDSARLVLMNALRSERTLRLSIGDRSVSITLLDQSITNLIWSEST